MNMYPIRIFALIAPLLLASLNTKSAHESPDPSNNNQVVLLSTQLIAHKKPHNAGEATSQEPTPTLRTLFTDSAITTGIGLGMGGVIGTSAALSIYQHGHTFRGETELQGVTWGSTLSGASIAALYYCLKREKVQNPSLCIPAAIMGTGLSLVMVLSNLQSTPLHFLLSR